MLINTTQKNEKVVLGLLSLICQEEDQMKEASQVLGKYRDQEGFDLFLYKDPETSNYVGLVGVESRRPAGQEDSKQETIIVHFMSVIPSFEKDNVDYLLYKGLKDLFPQAQITGAISEQMQDKVADFADRYRQESSSEEESD